MDSGKKLIFTNNIPKTGFLITPMDLIFRHHRQVSPSSGASGEGPDPQSIDGGKLSPAKSLPCLGPYAPLRTGPCPISSEPARSWHKSSLWNSETQGSPLGKVPGIPRADRPSPSETPATAFAGRSVGVGSFLLTPDANGKHTRWVRFVP